MSIAKFNLQGEVNIIQSKKADLSKSTFYRMLKQVLFYKKPPLPR